MRTHITIWCLAFIENGAVARREVGYQHTFQPNSSPLGQNYVCPGSIKLNGLPIDLAANYCVTMNSFLATGGDNFTVLNLGTDQLGGYVDLDAMEAYFVANSPVAPGSQNCIQQVVSCN
jgi:5'-nucleotidase